MTSRALVAAFFLAGWPAHLVAGEPIVLEVRGGARDRSGAVASVELPPALRDAPGLSLARLDTGEPVDAQRDPVAPSRLVWIVDEKLPAGQSRRYRLSASDGPRAEANVAVDDDGKQLRVSVAGKPVLAYNQAVVPSPDPNEPYYARSGHIHPVYNPLGQVVTDDFNPDHMHQHGIMFAWTKSTFEGRPSNCWDQKTGQGNVEHAATEAFGGGPVFGFFTTRLRHVNLNAPDGVPRPILDETWHVRVYRFTDYFLFDLVSTQRCAGSSPLTVEAYHYGGLMIRGARSWNGKENGDFLTSQGHTRADGNHTRPRWCDVHGSIGGNPSGVTVLGHPANHGAPQPVRLHPSMPYFCFAPAVLGAFTIEPDMPPYVSRYRFCVHVGPLDPREADRLWHDYADPPEVGIVRES